MKTRNRLLCVILSVLVSLLSPELLRSQTNDPPQNSEKLPECSAGPAIAIVVLACGAVVVISLYKFCKKHLSDENPQPPPVPPTHNSQSCTNCNPSHPSWPCTNCPTKKLITSQLTFDDSGVDLLDVSSNNWVDPYGNVYALAVTGVLESSTNLLNWERAYIVTGYVSYPAVNGIVNWNAPSNYVMIVYRPSGTPIKTNWSFLEYDPIEQVSSEPRGFYRFQGQ